jgi:hypothetical protein
MAWRESIAEVADTPWAPIGGAGAVAAIVFILWMLLTASTGNHWVPILDSANLAFHEAGHPLIGIFSSRLMVYGGTIFQLAFPAAAAASFWSRRHTLGFALCCGWTCQNLLNVATYMADARAMLLPLVGGADPATAHDWREIFSRWGMLDLDTAWAGVNRLIAWAAGLGTCAWLARRWQDGRA